MQDLTARARLRKVALRLFGDRGFEAASIRLIAAEAGVSPALVRHHFKSKDGLRAAVDEEVLRRFGEVLAELDRSSSPDDLMSSLGEISARMFGRDPELRSYLRRVLLEEAEASAVFFARLLDGARSELQHLADSGLLRDDADPTWAPCQLLFVAIGPMLLEPVLQPNMDIPLFEPKVLAQRAQANQRFVAHGLIKSGQDTSQSD
jgi:AcrR family transcriptional regulator